MLITSGDQNSNPGIKTHMLTWPHPNRPRTAGYLSILQKTQSASLGSLCSVTSLSIEPEANGDTFGNKKQTSSPLTLTLAN